MTITAKYAYALFLGFSLLALSPTASAKDCEANSGGACKGHWKCDASDDTKVCTDVVKRSGMECQCLKGTKKVRIREDDPRALEYGTTTNQNVTHYTKPNDTGGPPNVILDDGNNHRPDNDKPPLYPQPDQPHDSQQTNPQNPH